MVVDALSQNSMGSLAHIIMDQQPNVAVWQRLFESDLNLRFDGREVLIGHIEARLMLLDHICEAQVRDYEM